MTSEPLRRPVANPERGGQRPRSRTRTGLSLAAGLFIGAAVFIVLEWAMGARLPVWADALGAVLAMAMVTFFLNNVIGADGRSTRDEPLD